MKLKTLLYKPLKVILVGDAFVSPENMREALTKLRAPIKSSNCVFWGPESKEDFQKMALRIEKNGPDAVPYASELDKEIIDADMILTHFCPIPKALIEKAENLKLVGTCRGGMEHIAVATATEKNIPVLHVIRNAEPVADFTLGLILSLIRNIAVSHHALKSGYWRKEYSNSEFTTTLREMTVGILGIGNIGRLVAKKLAALGACVIGYDNYVSAEELKENGVPVQLTSLEDVFSQANIVSLHLRLSPETAYLVNERTLGLMKRTSYLINTSRSGLIDEYALLATLKEGRIAGAALDVFSEEPLSPDNELLTLNNVTLTPHIAGDVVDAIPKSPNLLIEELNNVLFSGKTDMVVNMRSLKEE